MCRRQQDRATVVLRVASYTLCYVGRRKKSVYTIIGGKREKKRGDKKKKKEEEEKKKENVARKISRPKKSS